MILVLFALQIWKETFLNPYLCLEIWLPYLNNNHQLNIIKWKFILQLSFILMETISNKFHNYNNLLKIK